MKNKHEEQMSRYKTERPSLFSHVKCPPQKLKGYKKHLAL